MLETTPDYAAALAAAEYTAQIHNQTHKPTTPTPTTRPHSWRIALPEGLKLLNENQTRRMHWHAKSDLAAAIRAAATYAARQALRNGMPTMQRAHIFYVIHPGPRVTRRDPANWAQSAKAAIDGLVDAGVLPDDDSTRCLGGDPRLGDPIKGSQLVLWITDLDSVHPHHLALLNPPNTLPGATQ